MMRRLLNVLTLVLSLALLASCSQNPSPSATPDNKGTTSLDKTQTQTPTQTPEPTPDPTPTPTPEPTPLPTPDNLVEYKGDLQHVFYHCLISYPEIAYASTYGKNLDTDCVTPTEFRRSLEQLYQNNYVLYDLNAYITVDESGKTTKNPIMVPEGKKPLIMSFDDINYYQTNLGKGICDKVILDKNGKLAMQTAQPDGSLLVTYDNCVIPMLEMFIEEHPDFAPFGVKGMLALTGFDGILGYRVQAGSPNREAEIEDVKPIIQALKDKGWYFASHSYSHFHTDKVDADRVITDTDKWLNEAGVLLGETQIYVFPYGETDKSGKSWDDQSTAKFKALTDRGFTILCGVGMPPYFRMYESHAFMDRQNIDGYTLRNQRKWFKDLIDPEYVYCQEERGGIPITG